MYTKWLIAENDARIFNYDINKDLAKVGGIQQAEKEFDENVLEIKNLVKNRRFIKHYILNKKTFFCMMKAIILTTHSIQN